MKDSADKRSLDALEVTVNMIAGILINYLLTVVMFGVSLEFAAATSFVFFVASWTRSYIVRRIFRKCDE